MISSKTTAFMRLLSRGVSGFLVPAFETRPGYLELITYTISICNVKVHPISQFPIDVIDYTDLTFLFWCYFSIFV